MEDLLYKGKPIDDMTKEELKEALKCTASLYSDSLDRHLKELEMLRHFRKEG